MPKIKTNRSAAKRFKKTGSGKFMRRKPLARHILTKKTSKRKRHLGKEIAVDKSDEKRIKKMIPY